MWSGSTSRRYIFFKWNEYFSPDTFSGNIYDDPGQLEYTDDDDTEEEGEDRQEVGADCWPDGGGGGTEEPQQEAGCGQEDDIEEGQQRRWTRVPKVDYRKFFK